MIPRAGRLLAALLVLLPALAAAPAAGYRTPSPALAAMVDAPLPPTAVLSTDRKTLLLLDRPEAPSIAELAAPELRLAGLRFRPDTRARSRELTYTGASFQSVAGGPARRIRDLPAGRPISDPDWSPDGRHLALVIGGAEGLELWVAEVASGRARRVTEPGLNAVLGKPFAWLDASRLVVRRVPAGLGAAPVAPVVPAGPVVQSNLGGRAPARTFDGLLANAHDEARFAYYAESELWLAALDGTLSALPVRGLVQATWASPDGNYVLVERLTRPFSYLVPAGRFPTTVEVFDRAGRPVHRVAELALHENTTAAVRPGPRQVGWRADAPATLAWVEDLPRGAKTAEGRAARDAFFTLAAPFTDRPAELQRFEQRVSGVTWADAGLALLSESQTAAKQVRVWRIDPSRPGAARTLLLTRNTEDRYGDPGRVATVRNVAGRSLAARSGDGRTLYLHGAGASPEGDRPFLDAFDLETRTARRLWRSAPPYCEEFIAFLDGGLTRALVARESATEPLHYGVRDYGAGTFTALTAFPHPYPEFTRAGKEVIRYRRADGVELSGTLHLPPGWTPARGRLPVLLWAYPREFLDAEHAAQVKATPERFTRVSVQGPLPFLLAGYAVLDDPAMPIVAEKGKKPNDRYREQLVANARAAVEELVRRGVADPARIAVGGHSYGAFMTANLLAHTDLFAAGIARSGAYNRTLTPFGFQSEQRSFWQVPAIYAAMSPFNFADRIKAPLLLIHGAADDNSGTFPLQSERFYAALQGQGAVARLALLPHEAHGYRARESLLHMLWEMETWLDTHVKHAAPAKAVPVVPAAAER